MIKVSNDSLCPTLQGPLLQICPLPVVPLWKRVITAGWDLRTSVV